MIRTSRLPSSKVALHDNPRHSRESDYMGFLGKKKKLLRSIFALSSYGAYVLFCHADFILVCHAKFLILFYMIRSMICDPIRDPVRDPIPDQV